MPTRTLQQSDRCTGSRPGFSPPGPTGPGGEETTQAKNAETMQITRMMPVNTATKPNPLKKKS